MVSPDAPTISVIIPAYNAARHICLAVESVLAQDYPAVEIIVVNDGSTDETLSVLAPYAGRIHLINQPNRGVSAARNTGLQAASGKYLVFLDADDLFLPGKLELQTGYLENHPAVCVVFSDTLFFEEGQETALARPFFDRPRIKMSLGSPRQNALVFMKQNPFPIHAAMVRAEYAAQVGGFDPVMAGNEDWDYWYRLTSQGGAAYQAQPTGLYRHRVGSGSQNKQQMLAGFNHLMRKIEASPIFLTLARSTRSSFYLYWGAGALMLDDAQAARKGLWKAVKTWALNLAAWIALGLVMLLGERAKVFIVLKQKLFG